MDAAKPHSETSEGAKTAVPAAGAAPKAAEAVPSAPRPQTKSAAPTVKPVVKKPASAKAVPKPVAADQAATSRRPTPTLATITAKKETTMATTIENTAQKTTDKAQAMFKDATDRAKSAADKGQKVAAEMTDFGKGNIEAMVESSKIAAKGMEAMAQDAMAFAKQSYEEATAAAKTLASAKSPTEFVKLQSDYVRTSFDALVAHNSRATEKMLKLVGEVVQPMSNRVSLAADKVKSAA